MTTFLLILLFPLPMETNDTLTNFDKLWDFNDPAQTEARFRELLPEAEQSGNADYHAQLLTQIARSQGLQRQFDVAHQTLDTVKTMLTNRMPTARMRYLLERGRVFNSSGKKEEAKPLLLEAFELGQKKKLDAYAIDAAHMLGIVETSEKQLEWNEKAIALAEASEAQRARKWLGPLYNNTGWSYHDLKQYDKALELFKKSLKWRLEQGGKQEIRIAKWCVARANRSLGRVEVALEMQKELLKEIEDNKLPPDGYVYEEIAECLWLLKRKPEARKYFQKAWEELSKDPWLVENEPNRLQRLKTLAAEEEK